MNTPEVKIDWEKYSHLFKEIEIPAKTVLLSEGDVSKYGYFIKKGCLRLWFNNKGKDVTFQFFFENEGVSSIESFRSGESSLFTIESIEPSTILKISKKNFEKIFMENTDYKEYLDEIIFNLKRREGHCYRLVHLERSIEASKSLSESHLKEKDISYPGRIPPGPRWTSLPESSRWFRE